MGFASAGAGHDSHNARVRVRNNLFLLWVAGDRDMDQPRAVGQRVPLVGVAGIRPENARPVRWIDQEIKIGPGVHQPCDLRVRVSLVDLERGLYV